MPRINKINNPTIIKIVLENSSSSIVEEYDPEIAVNGVIRFFDEIGISCVLIDPNTIEIPYFNDRDNNIQKRYQLYRKKYPELSHIGIQFI